MNGILTVKEAAAILRVHPETIKRWIRTGYLSGFKAGNGWRIKKEHIQALLDKVNE